LAAAVDAALEQRRARGDATTAALSARLSGLIAVGVVAVEETPGDPKIARGGTPGSALGPTVWCSDGDNSWP